MSSHTKVFIDSSCDIQYASFYIFGLYELYGKRNVKFSSKYFKPFKHDNHFFGFVIKDGASLKKIVVDFTDSSIIDPDAFQWCDVYGKINLDLNKNVFSKVIPIGPSFGIRIYTILETLWFALTNLLKSYSRIPNKRKFLSDYKAQFKRPKLTDYSDAMTKERYVFFMASLWKQEALTNQYRANFIEVCKGHQGITFEGGFAPRTRNDISGFEHLTEPFRIPMTTYLKQMKASMVAFNTPAVKGCHGWKFAEFLCMGKAILSLPLSRQMPAEILDGEHLLFTNGSPTDIKSTLDVLLSDSRLRTRLEKNALMYYQTQLAPEQVIKRLLDSC